MQTKYTYKDIIIAILTYNENLHCPPSQADIAKILGITRQGIGGRIKDNTEFETDETCKILDYYNVNLQTLDTPGHNKIIENALQNKYREQICTCSDQYDIQYIKYLPEEAKLSEITSVHTDLEIITAHWRRNAENLRIVPMPGNRLNTYAYPIQNRDILIVDTASTDISKEGIYLFSTMNNSILYVAKLSMKLGGEILIEWNENNETGKKEVSLERQKEVDMRILGRIIKNVSMTI